MGAKIVTLNSISLSWSYTSQKDKITNYTVLYRITTIGNAPIVPTDSNMVYFQKISVLETSALVKNLDESTCYDFFVCANNAIGRGPFSANQRMCTIDIRKHVSLHLRPVCRFACLRVLHNVSWLYDNFSMSIDLRIQIHLRLSCWTVVSFLAFKRQFHKLSLKNSLKK